jgi:hypothetical protein
MELEQRAPQECKESHGCRGTVAPATGVPVVVELVGSFGGSVLKPSEEPAAPYRRVDGGGLDQAFKHCLFFYCFLFSLKNC